MPEIKIYEDDAETLMRNLKDMYASDIAEETLVLKPAQIADIKNIFSEIQFINLMEKVRTPNYIKTLSFTELAWLQETIERFDKNLTAVTKNIEEEEFLKSGYDIDVEGLEKRAQARGLYKNLPLLNIPLMRERYRYPPEKMPTLYDPSLKIDVDKYLYRKYVIAILQMVFNHMDLVVCAVGDEGAGKSTKVSQDMFMVWHMLTEFGIIKYPLKINEMFVNTLPKFRDIEDKYFDEPFRIIGLDEGNELNRQNWKEPEVMTFWQRLRRERHNRRIKFICIPVLGEMIMNIILTRINFFFNMINTNELKTGLLTKGTYDMYIIPRGAKIYSPLSRRNFSKEEVKNKFYTMLKDKEYLKGMPREVAIHRGYCNGVWGFSEKEYIKELKESNKTYTVNKGLTLGEYEMFMVFKANFNLKQLGIKPTDIRYRAVNRILNRIKNYFLNDADKLTRYTELFKQKMAQFDGDKKDKSTDDDEPVDDDVEELLDEFEEDPAKKPKKKKKTKPVLADIADIRDPAKLSEALNN